MAEGEVDVVETEAENEWMLDLGNSTTGEVGLVMRIEGPKTQYEAWKKFKAIVGDGTFEIGKWDHGDCRIVYCNCYVNPERVTYDRVKKEC